MAERFKLPVGIFIMLRQDNKVLLQLPQNTGPYLKPAVQKINEAIPFYEDEF